METEAKQITKGRKNPFVKKGKPEPTTEFAPKKKSLEKRRELCDSNNALTDWTDPSVSNVNLAGNSYLNQSSHLLIMNMDSIYYPTGPCVLSTERNI